MPKPEWITEEEAAAMIGYRKRTLRRYVKSGKFPINYSTLTGRYYLYNKKDIDKLILEHSTLLKKDIR